MAWTAEDIQDFLSDNPGTSEALQVVMDASNDGDDEVEWKDVKDEDGMDSGRWGRLIQSEILREQEDGFVVVDPDAVTDALEDDITVASESIEVDSEGSSWQTRDKLAAVVSVGMMAGYYYTPIRNAVGSTINVIFEPLNDVLPFYAVILSLALITGLYSTLLQANMVDRSKVKQIQQKMQEITEREEAAKERGDDAALDRIQDEKMDALGDQGEMMKENFRPMAWIMLLTIPAFLWMYWTILDGGHLVPAEQSMVLPIFGEREWMAGAIGPMPAWIVWYFLCSMGFTQLLRKTLDLDATPT
ncbi:DUF106 domain-containing protein [Haloarchaeobius iranensis]|uniref:Uncharacterized membrane protein, DUF106 family n=1 Tax=Haloarchaeobius iranensis TaxID=996166 RepID=A0A1G9Z0Q2_9EURY|nr:DUF106 domain-containing protein [Haloarchaeobius iranensis]SDN14860.1 Uncharacterized membrane protein, DUF106 family [Haloarchaeobius iranensis]